MKKITSTILCILMLVSICLAATSCNAEKPKAADEIFFSDYSDSATVTALSKLLGIKELDKGILSSRPEKNIKAAVSATVSKLNVASAQLLPSPITLSANFVAAKDASAVSATGSYKYGNDALDIILALNAKDGNILDNAAVKLDGVMDKYVSIGSLVGEALEDGETGLDDIISIPESVDITINPEKISAVLNELVTAFNNAVDKTKLTETQKDITANGVTANVRAIEYTLQGEEIKAFRAKLAENLKASENINNLLSSLGGTIDITIDNIAADTKITFVRYFNVNTPCGVELYVNTGSIEDMPSGEITFSLRETTNKDGSYGELALNATSEGTTVSLTGKASVLKDSFEASVSLTAPSTPDFTFSAKGSSAVKNGATETSVNFSLSMGSTSVSLPVVLTVKEYTEKKADIAVTLSINVPDTIETEITLGIVAEHTDENPTIPAAEEIAASIEDVNVDAEALMTKLADTLTIIGSLIPEIPTDAE